MYLGILWRNWIFHFTFTWQSFSVFSKIFDFWIKVIMCVSFLSFVFMFNEDVFSKQVKCSISFYCSIKIMLKAYDWLCQIHLYLITVSRTLFSLERVFVFLSNRFCLWDQSFFLLLFIFHYPPLSAISINTFMS